MNNITHYHLFVYFLKQEHKKSIQTNTRNTAKDVLSE